MSDTLDLRGYYLQSSDVWFINVADFADQYAVLPGNYYRELNNMVTEKVGDDSDAFANDMGCQLILGFCMSQLKDELVLIPFPWSNAAQLNWHLQFEGSLLPSIFQDAKELLVKHGELPSITLN